MPVQILEQKARDQIDAMLTASGWVIQNYNAADFSAGLGVAIGEVPLSSGPCDYLLLVDRKAVGVIEAEKAGTTVSAMAEQSARSANNLPESLKHGLTGKLPFLYESTGAETFFRDEPRHFLAKDDALEESANLPAPEIIAQEISDDWVRHWNSSRRLRRI